MPLRSQPLSDVSDQPFTVKFWLSVVTSEVVVVNLVVKHGFDELHKLNHKLVPPKMYFIIPFPYRNSILFYGSDFFYIYAAKK